MVSLAVVKMQLAKAGCSVSFWGRGEVRELCNVLAEDETIIHASNGYHEGGFGLLVATDQRMLLVDRKPMYLTLDAISYGMIQEITLNYRLLNSSINIYTSNKCMVFKSWNHSRLRQMLMFSQQKILESRQQYRGDNDMMQRVPVNATMVNNGYPINNAVSQGANDSLDAFNLVVNGVSTAAPRTLSTTPTQSQSTSVSSGSLDSITDMGRNTYSRGPIFSKEATQGDIFNK